MLERFAKKRNATEMEEEEAPCAVGCAVHYIVIILIELVSIEDDLSLHNCTTKFQGQMEAQCHLSGY